MPTYEYQCRQCAHRLETFQNMSDTRLTVCPECGGQLRRLIGSGAGILMKGGASVVSACDRSQPCCGRDTPCERRPCE